MAAASARPSLSLAVFIKVRFLSFGLSFLSLVPADKLCSGSAPVLLRFLPRTMFASVSPFVSL